MSKSLSSGLGQEANRLLMSHRDAATEIPDGEFEISDLEYGCVENLVRRLIGTQAIEISETVTDNGDVIHVYELTEPAKDHRESVIQDRYTPLECNHSGVRNIDSETYSCSWGPCDETFDRSEVDLDA